MMQQHTTFYVMLWHRTPEALNHRVIILRKLRKTATIQTTHVRALVMSVDHDQYADDTNQMLLTIHYADVALSVADADYLAREAY